MGRLAWVPVHSLTLGIAWVGLDLEVLEGGWPMVGLKLVLMAPPMDRRCVCEKGAERDPKVFGSW